MYRDILDRIERTITVGRYKYLVEEKGYFVQMRILRDGLQHDKKTFPTMEHAMKFVNMQNGVD